MKLRRAVWISLLAAVLGLLVGGCASTESENTSSRPWNAPKGWEFGMPGIDQMH